MARVRQLVAVVQSVESLSGKREAEEQHKAVLGAMQQPATLAF
jgi:hypothetical protein